MKQAVLITHADLKELTSGLPWTVSVDGHEIVIMIDPSSHALAMPKRAARRTWTDERKRIIIDDHAALPKSGGKRSAYLRRMGVSSGLLHSWKKKKK